MKIKLSSAEFDALDSSLQTVYVKNGDGTYTLPLDDMEEVNGPLKRANERLKAEKDAEAEKVTAEKKRADDLKLKLDEIHNGEIPDAKKEKDVRALTASYEKREKEIRDSYEAIIAKKNTFITKQLVSNVALQMANEIAVDGDAALVLLPHIERRLQVDLTGDEPVTKVMDINGQPSGYKVDELKKEFVDNKVYASIIRGSKASGAGGHGGRSNANGGAGGKAAKDYTETERVELFRSDPGLFSQLFSAKL